MLLLLLPFFVLIYRFTSSMRSVAGYKYNLLALASLSPLALYPLGYDSFRWWSLAITNFIIVIILVANLDKKIADNLFAFMEKNRQLAILVVVLGFISGPLGITGSFNICGPPG